MTARSKAVIIHQETLRLLDLAIARNDTFIAEMTASLLRDNPQTIIMVNKARGENDALVSVKYALRGDFVELKSMAGVK